MRSFSLLSLSAFALVAPLSVYGVQHPVTVGGPGGLVYDPEFVNAEIGDTILFTFKGGNHTTTQSTLQNPCTYTGDGFDTGFVPIASDNTAGPFPAAEYTVVDTNPVWAFCAQANHCSQGMVFAINPGNQFPAFKAAAMGIASPTLAASTTILPVETSTLAPATTLGVPSATLSSSLPTPSTRLAVDSSTTLTSVRATTTSSSAVVPTSTSRDHKVIVGGIKNQQFFTPSHIQADVHDTITFEFHQTNHSVTASSFNEPCVPLSETTPNNPYAFDSGFIHVKNGAATFPTYTIQVNTTMPIWVFCGQAGHCGARMVFAVNAEENGGTMTYDAFSAHAEQRNGTAAVAAATNNSAIGSFSCRADTRHLVMLALMAIFNFLI